MTNKIVVITGLTCTGKSKLALDIAKEYNGEIVSADSVQIYKNLDIGSAKIDKDLQKEIKHYLIDIKEFNQNYNVGEFINDCKNAIEIIIKNNKLPIIVGGTGLYINALLNGYSLGETPANNEFREEHLALAGKYGNKFVWDLLYKLNPQKAETVHYNNIKRVIRYLEIEKFGSNINKQTSILKDFNVCALAIVDDREQIYNKINNRVDEMLNAGLLAEIKNLVSNGAESNMQSMQSIGYKEWFEYLNGNQSLKDTSDLIKQHTRNYCKRQLTYLKTIKGITLCKYNQAEKIIKEFLNDIHR